MSPQVTYGWFIQYPYCQYCVHNFRNTAGGHETGEIVGAKHYLWLGCFRQEELREDTVGIGMFLKLAIHMVHLYYWSLWYPPITKMIKIFNIVTSTDMFIYMCIYIYVYLYLYIYTQFWWDLRHAHLDSDYHNCVATWLRKSIACLLQLHVQAGKWVVFPPFLQGAGAVGFLVWEISRKSFSKKYHVVSSSCFE